jgi:hypothetical protein
MNAQRRKGRQSPSTKKHPHYQHHHHHHHHRQKAAILSPTDDDSDYYYSSIYNLPRDDSSLNLNLSSLSLNKKNTGNTAMDKQQSSLFAADYAKHLLMVEHLYRSCRSKGWFDPTGISGDDGAVTLRVKTAHATTPLPPSGSSQTNLVLAGSFINNNNNNNNNNNSATRKQNGSATGLAASGPGIHTSPSSPSSATNMLSNSSNTTDLIIARPAPVADPSQSAPTSRVPSVSSISKTTSVPLTNLPLPSSSSQPNLVSLKSGSGFKGGMAGGSGGVAGGPPMLYVTFPPDESNREFMRGVRALNVEVSYRFFFILFYFKLLLFFSFFHFGDMKREESCEGGESECV